MSVIQNAHPCFSEEAREHRGRIHLPVARKCNIQCNFCNRKYDCPNESRPGVTSAVLTPGQAAAYLEAAVEKLTDIAVVGIAGPGDPFANPEETLRTLELVRGMFPDKLLCVATNGLNLGPYLDDVARLGVGHVTVTMNAVDPDIGKAVYAWVRFKGRMLRGREAAETLIGMQTTAVSGLVERGIAVKINSVVLPGINDEHIPEIAKRAAELGATVQNCIPFYPAPGSVFEELPEPSASEVAEIRRRCEIHLPQMKRCGRCRADAAGLIGCGTPREIEEMLVRFASLPVRPEEKRSRIAAVSHEGLLINAHLGEADFFLVFERGGSGFHFIEARRAPSPGGGDARWKKIASILHDCGLLLVNGAGERPKTILLQEGLSVREAEGMIEDVIPAIFRGEPPERFHPGRASACGSGCGGGGGGCG